MGRSSSSSQLVDRVGSPFELLDVGGGLGIGGDRLGDLLGVDLLRLLELGDVELDPEQLSEALAERPRSARARRERDVVRHGRPEAHGGNSRLPAGVVQDADDARRPLVPRGLQPELLDEREIARGARDGRGARVRHVGEQRAERDDELDAEVAREADDELVEGAPAVVRLDAEEDHGVAVGARDRRPTWKTFSGQSICRVSPSSSVTVGRVAWKSTKPSGSISAKRLASQMRASVPAGERRSLAAVVPAAKGRDQDGSPQRRPLVDPELGLSIAVSLLADRVPAAGRAPRRRAASGAGGRQSTYAIATVSVQIVAARKTWTSDEPPGQRVAVLDLADGHLREQHGEQTRADPGDAREARGGAARGRRRRRGARSRRRRSRARGRRRCRRSRARAAGCPRRPGWGPDAVATAPVTTSAGASGDADPDDHVRSHGGPTARPRGRATCAPGLERDDDRQPATTTSASRKCDITASGMQVEHDRDPAERDLRDRAEERGERASARGGAARRRAAAREPGDERQRRSRRARPCGSRTR